MASPKDSAAERQLVQRCLEHDQAAREEFVRRYQGALLSGIRRHLRFAGVNQGEAPDIAEQFWSSLVAHDFRVLKSFHAKGGDLAGYVYLLGWQQVAIWLRHRKPEEVYLRPAAIETRIDPAAEVWPTGVVLEEFLASLPPHLRDFCHYLRGEPSPFRAADHAPDYERPQTPAVAPVGAIPVAATGGFRSRMKSTDLL